MTRPRHYESQAQQALITWLSYEHRRHPELAYLYAIPNGGLRNKREAARLKAEGVRAGAPDLCLPAPRGKWHGLYIEMKHGTNKLTPAQEDFLRFLGSVGYATSVCYDAQAARDKILTYLNLPKPEEKPPCPVETPPLTLPASNAVAPSSSATTRKIETTVPG